MGKRIKVCVLFGGKSAEHDISLLSAKNVVASLDPKKYDIALVGIDKSGRWCRAKELALPVAAPKKLIGKKHVQQEAQSLLRDIVSSEDQPIDVVFPVLHGPFGEDGTVQGLLKLAGLPFVGPGVLGSAVGMDKDVMKRLLRDAGIPVAKWVLLRKGVDRNISFRKVRKELGMPVFVKPANLGSSVGISKASSESEFKKAIIEAFLYDDKILIEEAVDGREIECAILGNERPEASRCGEIIPDKKHGFYSYEAKYLDEHGAELGIPAKISRATEKKIQAMAVKVFQTLCCEGMGRVDVFLKESGEVVVNEINTIPGFTKISMYPKLWEASGMSYPKLVDYLIRLALERHARESALKVDR